MMRISLQRMLVENTIDDDEYTEYGDLLKTEKEEYADELENDATGDSTRKPVIVQDYDELCLNKTKVYLALALAAVGGALVAVTGLYTYLRYKFEIMCAPHYCVVVPKS